jgi:hypothetical protein
MKCASGWVRRQIACSLVLLLAAPFANAAAALPLRAIGGEQQQTAPSVPDQAKRSDSLAVNSAQEKSQPEEGLPNNPNPVRSQVADQNGQAGTTQPVSQQAQDSKAKPVGTAAAPYEKTTGVAASRPAGAVIAPARQRRARSILIRVGVIVGGAVAIGTVVALTHGSPSRPH